MSRLVATLKLDVKLQARSQLYAIGIFVAVLLGFLFRFLVPVEYVGRGLSSFYLLALGGTTFMFGASMLLLEKGERTLEALRVSMITTRDYVVSKAITLTAFALVESLIVYGISARGTPANFAFLLIGVAVLGGFLTLVGLGLAASYDAVTRFLLPTGAAVAMVAQLPFLSVLGVGPDWLWYLIPTQAPLLILKAAFEPIAGWQWVYALVMSAAMLAGAWIYCARRFRRHIRLPGEEG